MDYESSLVQRQTLTEGGIVLLMTQTGKYYKVHQYERPSNVARTITGARVYSYETLHDHISNMNENARHMLLIYRD